MLALNANTTVPLERLIDGLWADDPPATAPKMVQLYVSQLRRVFAGGDIEIVTHGRGYELRARADAVDALRFERLLEEGAPLDALALWTGAPLADVADEPFAATEIRRLEEMSLRAAELAVDADLDAGRDQEALARLERLIDEHPLRERLHARRMLALYRSGRQSEALAAYVAARQQLVDEIGVEPGPELRELHERILQQDPALRPAQAARAPPVPAAAKRPDYSRWLVIGAAGVALVAGAVFALTRWLGEDRPAGISEGAIGIIDGHAAAITGEYRIGGDHGAVAAGGGSVWVANPQAGTVSRIDGERVATIDVGLTPAALAFGAGALWVVGGDSPFVDQVDPRANRVVQRISVGNGPQAVTVGYGAVWVATALDGEVVRIDLDTGRHEHIAIGGHPSALTAGSGAIWAAGQESGTVTRIDPRSHAAVDAISVGHGPSAVVAGLGAVWAANRQDGTVSRIDPASGRVTDAVPAGREPVALTTAAGALWVADAAGAVLRFDPHALRDVETVRAGSSPAGLAAVGDDVWVTAVAPAAAHRGGTLRLGIEPIALDPAIAGYDPDGMALVAVVYEGLVRYRRAGGTAGASLEPALASSLPVPADGGRRYVFRLRHGLRFSDGTAVRASDFRASIERIAAVQPALLEFLYDSIVGVPRCLERPRRCDLARGIATDDQAGIIAIRLRRPDPELLQNLSLPLAAVVPATTPRREVGSDPAPGTGPYRIERVTPGHGALLTRNPRFRAGAAPTGFVDRIAVTMMGRERHRVRATEAGRLDLTDIFTTATSRRLEALRTRVGARLQSASRMFTEFAWLNVHAAPFDDVRVRRALNLAVDRRRAVALTGGPIAGAPTCQVIPAGTPGYRPTCPFTVAPSRAGSWTAPDVARAQRLVDASGTRGAHIVVATYTERRTLGEHLAAVLRRLGYRVRVRVFRTLSDTYAPALAPDPPQIGINGWIADFPEPAGFLTRLVGCSAYVPGEPFQTANFSHYCSRSLDAAITRARTAGAAAGDAWQRIEQRIAARAPVVPLVDRRNVAVTSQRLANLQFHLQTGPMLDQVWVR